MLTYIPSTGELIWKLREGKPSFNTRFGGKPAGRIGANGYRMLPVFYYMTYAHILAWLIMEGDWPTGEIDHINGDKADNRWDNLRLATRTQNVANTNHKNRYGYKGVKRDRNRFVSIITVAGKRIYLGSFATPEAAHEAYKAASIEVYAEYSYFSRTAK